MFLVRSDDSKRRMWQLLHQAALGLDYLHKKGVIYGDLKLNNILIGEDGKAKISDFGLSVLRSCSTSDRSVPSGLRWSAPECLRRKPNFASDVYSFAMCMIEAAIGEPPFAFLSDDDVRDNVRKGVIPDHPEEMTTDTWELIVSMTIIDPSERLPLQNAIDKLKEFADAELVAEVAEARCCNNCLSVVLADSRFCSQCGVQVCDDEHVPLDVEKQSIHTPRKVPGLLHLNPKHKTLNYPMWKK